MNPICLAINSWGGASSRNTLDGKVYDENGKQVCELNGKWDEKLSRHTGGDTYQELWTMPPYPKGLYYARNTSRKCLF